MVTCFLWCIPAWFGQALKYRIKHPFMIWVGCVSFNGVCKSQQQPCDDARCGRLRTEFWSHFTVVCCLLPLRQPLIRLKIMVGIQKHIAIFFFAYCTVIGVVTQKWPFFHKKLKASLNRDPYGASQVFHPCAKLWQNLVLTHPFVISYCFSMWS